MIGRRDLLIEFSYPLRVICTVDTLLGFIHRTTFLGAPRYLARPIASRLLLLAINQSRRELPLSVLLSVLFLLSGHAGYYHWPGLSEEESLFCLCPGYGGVPGEGLIYSYLLERRRGRYDLARGVAGRAPLVVQLPLVRKSFLCIEALAVGEDVSESTARTGSLLSHPSEDNLTSSRAPLELFIQLFEINDPGDVGVET